MPITRRPLVVGPLVLALVAGCGSPLTPPPLASPTVAPSPASSPAPSAAPSAEASIAASASIVVSSSPTTGAASWHMVSLPNQASIISLVDITAGPNAIVAIGGTGPNGAGAAWSSGDQGQTWNEEMIPADSRTPNRIVAWGEKFLVAGAGEFDCPHPFALQTWVRITGAVWAAAPDSPIFCVGGSAEVAVQDGKAVLVGTGTGDVPFVWSSSDGLRWTDRSSAVHPDMAPQAIVSGDAGFTVFGSSPTGPWALSSADGSTWTIEALPGNQGVSILAAFLREGRAAALAESGGAVGVLSKDASGAWLTEPATGLDAERVGRVVAIEDGLVAVGGGEVGPAAWVSAEGTAWRAVELPTDRNPGTILTGALAVGRRAFLIGQTSTGGRAVGVIWDGTASLLAP